MNMGTAFWIFLGLMCISIPLSKPHNYVVRMVANAVLSMSFLENSTFWIVSLVGIFFLIYNFIKFVNES